MPIHDWTRVRAATFHGFHLRWIAHLTETLNGGLLPDSYYADSEQSAPRRKNADVLTLREAPTLFNPSPAGGTTTLTAPQTAHHFNTKVDPLPTPRRIVVRQAGDDTVVALLEIVSRANKDRPRSVRQFATKAVDALLDGVHVLVIDILPPGPHDPRGIHDAVWTQLSTDRYDPPADQPLTLAGYAADPPQFNAHVQPAAVGAALPDMPLFLTPVDYVNVPLQITYDAAWRGTPKRWREVLEKSS